MPPTISNKKRKELDTVTDEEPASKQDLKAELLETKQKLAQAEDRATKAEERAKKAEEMVECLKAKAASKEEDDDDDDDVSDGEESVAGNDPWSDNFRQLREYRIMNGDCNVTKATNQKLHKWILNQRCAYAVVKNGKKGSKISPERIVKLEGIGFSWGSKYPQPPDWDTQLEELRKYKNAMGNCNITMHPTNPSPLAKWVSIQRSEYKRFKKGTGSLLKMEQIGQLNEIGFKWKGPRLT